MMKWKICNPKLYQHVHPRTKSFNFQYKRKVILIVMLIECKLIYLFPQVCQVSLLPNFTVTYSIDIFIKPYSFIDIGFI